MGKRSIKIEFHRRGNLRKEREQFRPRNAFPSHLRPHVLPSFSCSPVGAALLYLPADLPFILLLSHHFYHFPLHDSARNQS